MWHPPPFAAHQGDQGAGGEEGGNGRGRLGKEGEENYRLFVVFVYYCLLYCSGRGRAYVFVCVYLAACGLSPAGVRSLL